jgi:type I restriction-modification system DNA methylase subunit
MPAPPPIADLVERFEQQGDAYKSGQYNEAQLRKEFVDPMFKALGWDMETISGYAEAYKDVIHEDAIKIGGATKAPDYCFRIGGTRKFFLEAKKPSVDIKTDAHPAYQLRRYAWSAKLPLSILTDFEEFAVYDCRVEPRLSDKASVARVLYLNFREYASRWDDIAKIFARDAILKGSFDKFAESTKAKRGTAEVDDAFLSEIEKWRADLARNLALRNPTLSQRDLNFSVQRTIDRIVFLRICEDRRIEVYGRLQALLNGEHTYRRLYQLFREADERYNSGLFYFQKEKDRVEPPDDLTPELEMDDAILKGIIRRLYYPESPYEFSVLPADILGQVYEQFLGKVIRLAEGHQARIEDKPEVKKAGGVYYTPTYIVDYIVKNTVGKLLEGKTPRQAAKLRILDPACGSGSFLIGAYQYLLDWHRDWYSDNEPKKWATGKNPAIYQGPGGEWKLTTTERKCILLQSIFGVDIDSQAVEVTKLSLLLKVLEGESEQTLATQLRFYHERALPDLGRNIKCGNSLVGPDFYDQQEMGFLDEEQRYRINVFDWRGKDGFPEIMKAGGFDAVIGNPPYVRIQTSGKADLTYFSDHYETAVGNFDIYCLFVERGISVLRPKGLLGFIVAHRFYKTDYGKGLREFISRHHLLRKTIDFDGFMVFPDASINTCLLFLERAANKEFFGARARFSKMLPSDVAKELNALDEQKGATSFDSGSLTASRFTSAPWVFVWRNEEGIWQKLTRVDQTLADVTTHIFQGVKTGADGYYIGRSVRKSRDSEALVFEHENGPVELETDLLKPLIKGGEMRRYAVGQTSRRILFPYGNGMLLDQTILAKQYPKTWLYLSRHKNFLANREDGKMKGTGWFGYTRSQALTTMFLPKIITPDYYAHASYCLDHEGRYFFCGGGAGGYGIVAKQQIEPKFLMALLNSSLLDWFLHKISLRAYQTAYMYVKKYIEPIPIYRINMSNRADKDRHDRIVSLAERMLELEKELAAAKTGDDKTRIQRQTDATNAQIDKVVYELYGLSEEEIKIVERSGM